MKDEIGWWYRFEDGTYAAHAWMYAQYAGKWDWYYFDEAGYMKTGWLLNNGHWYYLYPRSIGTNYCGSMAKSTTIDDSYAVDENGVWKE